MLQLIGQMERIFNVCIDIQGLDNNIWFETPTNANAGLIYTGNILWQIIELYFHHSVQLKWRNTPVEKRTLS